MRISDWSSDVCSSDLECLNTLSGLGPISERSAGQGNTELSGEDLELKQRFYSLTGKLEIDFDWATLTSITNYSNNDFLYEIDGDNGFHTSEFGRSEEHTSELQSLMRTSYAVFCLKKKNNTNTG